jgi:hypothetical protein
MCALKCDWYDQYEHEMGSVLQQPDCGLKELCWDDSRLRV